MANEKLLGLIGYPLSHSFSKRYFGEKFEAEGIAGFRYELFPLEDITELPKLIKAHPNLLGLNVTIPYKEVVIPYLTSLSDSAQAVGAVNTIHFTKAGLIGYNTDIYGFEMSLRKALTRSGLSANRAMVLGTGGAAKASR
ncbi:MAG: shikimate dehydrogenase, partial [Saprospiraceae bacterium]|nr:shikimate dehydrogenase [Saprospiraceae bacterium]